MAEEVYYLNRFDREKLKALWADFTTRKPESKGHTKSELPQAPDVYIARSPTGGVPALDQVGTGTSTDDAPGSADCYVYQIIHPPGTGDDPYLLRVGQVSKTVYNIGNGDIEGDSWFLVIRDKFGKWIAAVGDNGGRGVWRFVKPSTENVGSNGLYHGYVQDWTGSGYIDGDRCWIYLAAGETVVEGERYEGEPLSFIDGGEGTGTAHETRRIYGIAGNEIECAPDECDENGTVISWARLYHRAPFKIVSGFSSSACAEGTGTGTGIA